MTPKAQAKKRKHQISSKLKTCASKDTINKVKQQPTQQEIFANPVSDKELVSQICKDFIELNNKRQLNFFKWLKDLKKRFSKEDITNGQCAHEKILDIIRRKYYFIPTKMAIIKVF